MYKNKKSRKFNQADYDLLIKFSNSEDKIERKKIRIKLKKMTLSLEGADLSKANLRDINLSGADLCDANLNNANLFGVSFENANLTNANLSNANLIYAEIDNVKLKGTNMSNADLRDAYLYRVDLSDVNMQGINLSQSKFYDVDFTTIDFSGMNLSKADFSEQNLDGADFSGADLSRIDLSGFDLTEVKLQNTHLFKANLSEANLSGVNLSGAELSEADLRCTNFSAADLSLAHLNDANLSGADLRKANLTNADLTAAKLIGTIWIEANITGSHLYGTTREDWNIQKIICDYIYLDLEGEKRTPKDRDFKPGEFKELYESLPEIKYFFSDEFTPLTPMVMDNVVNSVYRKHPQFDLRLDSFHSRGQPHATFTVIHEEYADKALEEITHEYEKTIKKLEGKVEILSEIVSGYIERPQLIQNVERIEHMGHSIDINSSRDTNLATDHGTINVTNTSSQDVQNVYNLIDQTITESTSSSDAKQDAIQQLDNMTKELSKPEPDQGRLKRCYEYIVGLAPKVAEVIPWTKLIEKTLGV